MCEAGPASTIDPQAGAKAVGIPHMADDRGAVAENIVPASGIRHRQALAGKAVGAIEAVAGIAIGPIEAPGRLQELVDAGLAQKRLASVSPAIEEQSAHRGEIAGRNPEPSLRREERSVGSRDRKSTRLNSSH